MKESCIEVQSEKAKRVLKEGHHAAHASESSCITIACMSGFVSLRPLTRPGEQTPANPWELAWRANINLRKGWPCTVQIEPSETIRPNEEALLDSSGDQEGTVYRQSNESCRGRWDKGDQLRSSSEWKDYIFEQREDGPIDINMRP